MRPFDLLAILLVLTAIFSYINIRFLRLPSSIGVMALTLVTSLCAIAAGRFFPHLEKEVRHFVGALDFSQALLHGMLGFLLFAGALNLNLNDLTRWKLPIGLLATVSVLLSTVLVGGMMWLIFAAVGISARPIACLLFGALISPTDPIAVLVILKQLQAPRPMEIKVAGESLFNDGISVVIFLGLLDVATSPANVGFAPIGVLFAREALGGAAFGFIVGLIGYALLRSVDHYPVEILLSLALAAGGYALADRLGLSAPLAVVVAGLLIGNQGRSFAMSPTTIEHLDLFWELVDDILNAVLFVAIGLEVLVLEFPISYLLAGLLAIGAELLARLLSVALPIGLLKPWYSFERGTLGILTWGGLRGGISVAMALSLPNMPEREAIVAVTYISVVFSILVQGLSIGPLMRRWIRPSSAATMSRQAEAITTQKVD